jgi:hypothetical protein
VQVEAHVPGHARLEAAVEERSGLRLPSPSLEADRELEVAVLVPAGKDALLAVGGEDVDALVDVSIEFPGLLGESIPPALHACDEARPVFRKVLRGHLAGRGLDDRVGDLGL